jgi:protein O-mannosyl-transferase
MSQRRNKRSAPAAPRAGPRERTAGPQPDNRSSPPRAAGLAAALAATAAVYLGCLGNAFVFDDIAMITRNPRIGEWSFLWRSFAHDAWWFRPDGPFPKSAYYRPLEDVWLGLNYHLFGLDPGGWHLTSIAVHLLCVWLVFTIAAELTRSGWAATAAAFLFGLAPLHAQAVAWPTSIPLPMSAAFELGALILFVRRRNSPIWLIPVAWTLFCCALLSHESAVTFPLVLGAYVLLLEPDEQSRAQTDRSARRAKASLRALLDTVPYLAAAAVYLGLRLAVLGFIRRPAPETVATWGQVALSIPGAAADYVMILAAPWLAGPAHQFQLASSPVSPAFYLPLLALAALAVAGFFALRATRHRMLYLFLAAWAAFAIAPMMNLHDLVGDSLIEDRYVYFASAAVYIFAADLGMTIAAIGAEARHLVTAGAVAIAAVYAFVLWHVEGYWHDEVTLFSKCIDEYPGSATCHGRLAMALERRGDFRGARREFSNLYDITHDDSITLFKLGRLDQRLGNERVAAEEISRGLANMKNVPASLLFETAQAAYAAGDSALAEQVLARASSDPAAADNARFMSAQVMAARHNFDGAARLLQSLASRRPREIRVWLLLAAVMHSQGDFNAAAQALAKAVELQPGSVHLRMRYARVLRELGRNDQALAQCRSAAALEPRNRRARACVSELGDEPGDAGGGAR